MSPYIIPGIKRVNESENIINAVCHYFGITEEAIRQRCRKKEIIAARQTAVYFMRQNKTLSLKSIGKEVGLIDHTSVIHSLNKMNGFIDIQDESTLTNIAGVKKLLMVQT